MPYTEQELAERSRARMIEKAKEYQPGTYLARFVAPVFQRMIRAEAGARIEYQLAMKNGTLKEVWAPIGTVVCVTCGLTGPWSSGGTAGTNRGGMQTGHFIASRRNSIVLEESNCACQCARDNIYGSGEQKIFAEWMRAVHGQIEINRLQKLKDGPVRQFDREELVDLRINYQKRLKKAEEAMR